MDATLFVEESGDRIIGPPGSFIKNCGTRRACFASGNTVSKREADRWSKAALSEGGKSGKSLGRAEEKNSKTERHTSADHFRSKCADGKVAEGRSASSATLGGEQAAPVRGGRWAGGASSGSSSCCGRPGPGGPPRTCLRFPFRPQRRCRSSCEFSRASFPNCHKGSDSDREFHKVKRSLRLLGFEPSDFGIRCGGAGTRPAWKPRRRSPTFSTRIAGRSVSLDSLRVAVRRSFLDDCLDESLRRLLAQAAYEEWYFTKEQELRQKREEDRIQLQETKLKLRDDFQRKKENSEREFQKWLTKKKTKRKGQEGILLEKQQKPLDRSTEANENSEKAFLNWRKSKEKEINRKKIQKRKEEEEKLNSEKQKAERKITAEKAFQQWKAKLEENERRKSTRGRREKGKKHEAQEGRTRAEGSQIAFETWKEAKDNQRKEKLKQWRESEKAAKEERLAHMEERLYEAEQAFEDWLQRVESRKQSQFYGGEAYRKLIPWIPA